MEKQFEINSVTYWFSSKPQHKTKNEITYLFLTIFSEVLFEIPV